MSVEKQPQTPEASSTPRQSPNTSVVYPAPIRARIMGVLVFLGLSVIFVYLGYLQFDRFPGRSVDEQFNHFLPMIGIAAFFACLAYVMAVMHVRVHVRAGQVYRALHLGLATLRVSRSAPVAALQEFAVERETCWGGVTWRVSLVGQDLHRPIVGRFVAAELAAAFILPIGQAVGIPVNIHREGTVDAVAASSARTVVITRNGQPQASAAEGGEIPKPKRGMSKWKLGAAGVVLAAAIGGAIYYFTGKTIQQVLNEAQPKYAALVARLQKVAASLPAGPLPAGVTKASPGPLELVYDEKSKTFNCDFLAINRLEHFIDEDNPTVFWSHKGSGLSMVLHWLGSPPGGSRARKEFAEDVARPLGLRYVVLHRLTHRDFVHTGQDGVGGVAPSSFNGGGMEFEGFVVDLQSDTVVASYHLSAEPASSVTYGSKFGGAEKAVEYSTQKAARERIKAALEPLGATIVLDD